MAILVGLIAIVINQTFCLLLLRAEKWTSGKREIASRGEILYLEDYDFFKYGDHIFLGVMDFAIVFVLIERWPLPPWWAVAVCVAAVVIWTALWHWIWLQPSHNPDSLYPRTREVSLVGRIHLGYFATQYLLGFVGLAMIALMITGDRAWSPVTVVGLAAAGLYFITFFSDLLAGRFTRKH